jgi:outer membrane protein TolC
MKYRPFIPQQKRANPFKGCFPLHLLFFCFLPMALVQTPSLAASSIIVDCLSMEQRAQEINPLLLEKRLNIEKAEQKLRELEMSVILPKFTVESGVGPAPGLNLVRDTTSLNFINTSGDTQFVAQYQKEYDFSDWGPFFGIEATAIQPLNFSRYRAGHRAAKSQIKVTESEFQKDRMDISEEAQKLYFSRIYAGMMLSILKDAAKELDKAQSKMESLLDEGDESVKQTDLLELKVGRFTLEKAKGEANLGVARSDLGLRFMLQIPDSIQVTTQDTVLTLRSEQLPTLDSLKMLTLMHHPDLKRLANGLAARRELVRVAKGEMGPDIFLFGKFNYTKAWSTDRQSGGSDPFARDPLNEITAVGGLGVRLSLNFWQRYEKVRKEKIELNQLHRTETYAARGLLLKMQDEYVQMLNFRTNVTESQKSLRAAEAWLKAAAMKYDLDPGAAKDLIGPYRAVLGAKKDFFESVLNYNLAVSKVIKSVGWTLSDYIHTLPRQGLK